MLVLTGLAARIHLDPSSVSGTGLVFPAGVAVTTSGLLISIAISRAHPVLQLGVLCAAVALVIDAYASFYLIGFFNGEQAGIQLTTSEAVYFSIVTLTTLGYGDFTPLGDNRMAAASQALTGYVVLGMIVAVLGSFLARSSAERDEGNQTKG
ncbi:potassium channel family protein [Hyphobacterium sp.]|uniref:potassium channel family protein n=1 Tax=Hyphobacterium sp. TaxID=2004662 RepID=UPI003BACDC34